MKQLVVAASAVLAFGSAVAKLPALDDAAKAKAAEAAAKAAWQGKVDAYQLCKVQDRIAAQYRKTSSKQDVKASSAMPVAAKPAASAASAASVASGSATPTPAVASAPPACAEPGPFTYNAPSEKPLETSGAHSPAGNATSPPSVKQDSAQMAPSPAKK